MNIRLMTTEKIVHVLESTATGTLTMVATLANLFAENGCDITVIYSQRNETPEWLSEYFHKSVKLIRLDMRPVSKSPLVVFRLRSLLKKLEPDIVHLHSSIAGFIGRMAVIGMPDIKVYYSPHCISFMMANLSVPEKYLYVLLERFANLLRGEYVACSVSERDAIVAHLPAAVVHQIDNAIVIDQNINSANVFNHPDSVTIINVGEIRTQKDPLLFAQIAEKLRHQSDTIDFIWIGDGNIALKNRLTDSGVQVTGWMTKEKVLSRLSASDLYLSTSRWEGLPVSMIEAMSLGLPLIAASCPGNTDLVVDGVNGLLFENVEQAIESIMKCMNDKEFSVFLSKNGQRLASERYSIDTFQNRFSDLYQIALSATTDQVQTTPPLP